MVDFIFSALFWTLALYGLIEIVRTIYYIYTNAKIKDKGIYLIVGVKDQEKNIEAFIRSILFRYLYTKEDYINDVLVVDLNSKDKTMDILKKLECDYDFIKVVSLEEYKELLDSI